MGDRLLIIIMTLVIGGYLFLALSLRELSFSGPVGPKTFPILIGVAGLLALGLLIVERLRGKNGDAVSPAGAAAPSRPWAVVGVVGWTVLYYMVFERLGFVLATIPYLLLLMVFFNRGRWVANLSVSLVFTVGVYVVFNRYLQLNLPAGLLGF